MTFFVFTPRDTDGFKMEDVLQGDFAENYRDEAYSRSCTSQILNIKFIGAVFLYKRAILIFDYVFSPLATWRLTGDENT